MILTYINFSDKEDAKDVAADLVASGLVYSVDILPAETIYAIEGRVAEEKSYSLMFYAEKNDLKKIDEYLDEMTKCDCCCEPTVVVGGTFDPFHRGHEELLKTAFSLGDVSVGLTSDKMAKERKGRTVEPFLERKKTIESFAKKFRMQVDIRKIEDEFGFAVDEDFDYIVVSKETKDGATKINKERKKKGLDPIEPVTVKFLLAEDKKPISSTRIANKEIDRDGKLIK